MVIIVIGHFGLTVKPAERSPAIWVIKYIIEIIASPLLILKIKSTEMKEIMELLQNYFKSRKDIAFAFLFGSAVRGQIRQKGDINVAVYFNPEKGLEWEAFGKIYS